MNLTIPQLKKLADYVLDVSKGTLVAGLSLPFIYSSQDAFIFAKTLFVSIFMLLYSLELVKVGEDQEG